MNYQHAYHAGNFADVIKHILLIDLLQILSSKPKPLCYLETHAGAGFYDLAAYPSAKTKEYLLGIKKIMDAANPPQIVKQFLQCVHRINNELESANFRYYPGSPLIAKYSLSPAHQIIACELEPSAYQALKQTFLYDTHIATHHMDGFLALKAFLPPEKRRGLVFIDPPYEHPDEFLRLAKALPPAIKKWETGVYAIWFPIKNKHAMQNFYRSLTRTIIQPMLAIELTIYPDLPNHLQGCGFIIINPPWLFEHSLNDFLPWLWRCLSINGEGGFKIINLQ